MTDDVSMTGVAGATLPQVETALRAYAAESDGEMTAVDWTGDPSDVLVVAETQPGQVSISYPADFLDWDNASAFLSDRLKTAAFSFHIFEGEFWMYGLFANGEQIDGFNPLPEHWGPLPAREREAWQGNASLVARHWPGVSEEDIAPYLVHWDETVRAGRRARPDDRFTFRDAWQLLDFLRRLGLQYPFDERTQPLGKCFLFDVDDA